MAGRGEMGERSTPCGLSMMMWVWGGAVMQCTGSQSQWGSALRGPGSKAVWGELPREKARWLFTILCH